jgi:hypothetical protein
MVATCSQQLQRLVLSLDVSISLEKLSQSFASGSEAGPNLEGLWLRSPVLSNIEDPLPSSSKFSKFFQVLPRFQSLAVWT